MDNLQNVQLGAISTDYHSSVKILATAYTQNTVLGFTDSFIL